jgi:hypothetical protein
VAAELRVVRVGVTPLQWINIDGDGSVEVRIEGLEGDSSLVVVEEVGRGGAVI